MKLKSIIKSIFKNKSYINDLKKIVLNEYMLEHGYDHIDKIQANDIVIVGFPKSGNTWMQNLIAGVLFGIDTTLLPDKLTQVIIPNQHGEKYYKRLLDFTCFKSHQLPNPNYKKVIYIIRDGRDAISSYYNMNQADGKSFSLRDMIIDGKGIFPSKWHEHVKAWQDNPFGSKILWIRYEDLHNDCLSEMKRVCDFLEIERDDQTIMRSIRGNSFKKMQQKEKTFGWDNKNWNPDAKFIRQGKIGNYKNEIPSELISFFVKEAKVELLSFGYEI